MNLIVIVGVHEARVGPADAGEVVGRLHEYLSPCFPACRQVHVVRFQVVRLGLYPGVGLVFPPFRRIGHADEDDGITVEWRQLNAETFPESLAFAREGHFSIERNYLCMNLQLGFFLLILRVDGFVVGFLLALLTPAFAEEVGQVHRLGLIVIVLMRVSSVFAKRVFFVLLLVVCLFTFHEIDDDVLVGVAYQYGSPLGRLCDVPRPSNRHASPIEATPALSHHQEVEGSTMLFIISLEVPARLRHKAAYLA